MSHHNSNLHKGNGFIVHDLVIIAFSILLAVTLVRTDLLSELLLSTQRFHLLGSFIAGIFFTSVFTTAPAIATLGDIARYNPIFSNALFGAMGAVVGDLIIFQFVKDRLSEHVFEVIGHKSIWKKIRVLFKLKYFRWLTFLFGGFIIASPLPDELGIGLLGFSKMKLVQFIPISLIFNFVGIVLLGIVARSV